MIRTEVKPGGRKLTVAWLRYDDTFVRLNEGWRFAERKLYVDWTRPGAQIRSGTA